MERKYWITPDGDLIGISDSIAEHFRFFNSGAGKKLAKKYSISTPVEVKDLPHVLSRGLIRVLVIGDTLNISYATHSVANLSPVSKGAKHALMDFIFKNSDLEFIQYDAYIGSKAVSDIQSKRDFLVYVESKSIDKKLSELIARILG